MFVPRQPSFILRGGLWCMKIFVSWQTCRVQLPQWILMSFCLEESTLLMSMRSQTLERTTSFLLLHRPLVSRHIHMFSLNIHASVSADILSYLVQKNDQSVLTIFLNFSLITPHLFCSTWCSCWAWSGGCGRLLHRDQLGKTTGSHHW